MTTPDLTALNELTLYDVTPRDLVSKALADAQFKMPDWAPRDGNTEMVLLEAMSLLAAEVIYAINRVPPGVTESVIRLLGVTRSPGVQPTMTVRFELSDSLGHDIPAGSVIRLVTADGTVDFTTDIAASAAIGVTSIPSVPATGLTFTSSANGTAVNTQLQVISALAFVDQAFIATAVTAGADPESDFDWMTRAVQRFARLNDSLVLSPDFASAALDYPQVHRAHAVDNWNGTATVPGNVSVAVLGTASALISGGDKAVIAADLQARAMVNLLVHVIDPSINTVDVQAVVKGLPGWDPAIVQQNVAEALSNYLSTDTWGWSATVRRNELLSLIDNVEGVDYVDTLSQPVADINLTGAAPLADLGASTITVL